jgi:hypothetical protein
MNYSKYVGIDNTYLTIFNKKYIVGNLLQFFVINGPEGNKIYQCLILDINHVDKNIKIQVSNNDSFIQIWNLKTLYLKYLESRQYLSLKRKLDKYYSNSKFYSKYKSEFNRGDLLNFKNGRRAKITGIRLKIRSVPHRLFPEIYFHQLQNYITIAFLKDSIINGNQYYMIKEYSEYLLIPKLII